MADKVQINPQLTAKTRDLLKQACQQQGKAQGDIIEEALLAFLVPSADDSTLTRLVAEQAQLAGIVGEVQATMARLVAALEGLAASAQPESAPTGTVPIATYAQMYGAMLPAPAEAPPQVVERPTVGRLWRWFRKEETL